MILDTLPRIITVEDYHTILYLPSDIKKYLGISVSSKELGFSYGQYIGIVYQGRLPNKDVINVMLEKQRIVLEEK
jgi:hypothetical protein